MTTLSQNWCPANGHASSLPQASVTAAVDLTADRAEWDRRMADYLRCDLLVRADATFGPFSKAMDAHRFCAQDLKAKYGADFRDQPEALALFRDSLAMVRHAEEEQLTLLMPLWAAQRALLTTPAPDLAAAMFKHELVEREEMECDANLDREPFDIIAEDVARLAGEAA